jgi:FKBP-type peptidyl-prolyl cis-trans isomerase FklB
MSWKRIAIGAAALFTTAGIAVGAFAIRGELAAKPTLKTAKEKLSYTAGVSVARNLTEQGLELDGDAVARGLKDVLSRQQLLMAEDALRETMNAYQEEQKQKQAEAVKKVAESNRQAGEAFLAENAKDEGVVSLPSGLQYKILQPGQGKRPTDTDTIECHYRGLRIDGKEFQSSHARGQPATVAVAAVIPGWKEALKLMPVGSKWKLFVPPQLAYGERGVPGKTAASTVGPNEPLIFEVELLAIKSSAAREQSPAAKAHATARKG